MKFCLISSNIRFDNPSDGVNAWPHRREIFTQAILTHSPDIIATQEGRFDQLKDFQALLKDYDIVDHHRSWIKERMYPTFFVKKGTLDIIRSDDWWLSRTPEIAGSLSFGSAFPRLMTWMRVQPKESEKTLLVVNTHLDHVKRETRVEQIKVLLKEITRLKDTGSRLVIMGDFNDDPESDVRSELLGQFPELQDSWSLFNQQEESSHHRFDGKIDRGSRIDWILVEQSISIHECFHDKREIRGQYPSDHFPVVCRISI
jgi:endonuclease/exonuclease/phosphatase family metal-dependent hydrolase